jgi:hypothetical protein
MLFNRAYDAQVTSGPQAAQYATLQQEFDAEIAVRRTAAERNDRDVFLASDARLKGIRAKAVGLVKEATGDLSYNDVNYVFSTFITTQLPIGLVGLMIAAILRRRCRRAAAKTEYLIWETSDAHYLLVSKPQPIAWGLVACVAAMRAANQGSLIEVVNRYGSFFYGSLLGVFIAS